MFDDLINKKKNAIPHQELGIICKHCGSTDTAGSIRFYRGSTFGIGNKKYKPYKQYIRCYNCNKQYLYRGKEEIIEVSNGI